MIKFIKRLLNKKYHYFVSYVFRLNNSVTGKSRAQIVMDKKIDSLNDIERIEESIRNKNGFESCVIQNYIPMKKPYIEKENENV